MYKKKHGEPRAFPLWRFILQLHELVFPRAEAQRRRGFDRELAAELLDEAFSEPTSAAFDALCKKQKMQAFSDMKEKNRAYAFLVRRGFGSEEISAAFEKYEMMITGEEISE